MSMKRQPTPASVRILGVRVDDVTLPEAGRVVKFSRSVQLSTDKPMRVELVMVRDRDQSSWLALPLCLLAAVMTVFKRGKPVASSIP